MKKIIALLLFLFSSAVVSAETPQAGFLECTEYVQQYVAVLNGDIAVVEPDSVDKCLASRITTSPMYKIGKAITNKAGVDYSIEKWSKNKLIEPEEKDLFSDKEGIINLLLFPIYYLSLIVLIIACFAAINTYIAEHESEDTTFAQVFKEPAIVLVFMLALLPFGSGISETSIIGIAIAAFAGAVTYITSFTLLMISPFVAYLFSTTDFENDFSEEIVETTKALVGNDLKNYARVKSAEINRKNLDIAFHMKTDLTGKILAESVQDTLDCYKSESEIFTQNDRIVPPLSAQNGRCYSVFVNNSYYQDFGGIQIKKGKSKEKVEFWISKENEVEKLQEEVRRYVCVNTFDSANKELRDAQCIDYKNNTVEADGKYAKMITTSLSREEIMSMAESLLNKRVADINQRIKQASAKEYQDFVKRQINYIMNGTMLSLYFTYSDSVSSTVKIQDYLKNFEPTIVFNGYEETNSIHKYHLLQKSQANSQNLMVPVEIPEFNMIENQHSVSSYFESIVPASTFKCSDSITACPGLKESNIAEIEQKTATIFGYLTKTYAVMKSIKSTFSFNNVLIELTLFVMLCLIKLLFVVLFGLNYLGFIFLANKFLAFSIYFALIPVDACVLIVKKLVSVGFRRQFNAKQDFTQLLFNAIIEPIIFIFSYVLAFSLLTSIVGLTIYLLGIELDNTIQSLITLNFDNIANLFILLFALAALSLLPPFVAQELTNKILKFYAIRSNQDIGNDIEGFYNEGKSYGSKIIRKFI